MEKRDQAIAELRRHGWTDNSASWAEHFHMRAPDGKTTCWVWVSPESGVVHVVVSQRDDAGEIVDQPAANSSDPIRAVRAALVAAGLEVAETGAAHHDMEE